MSTRLTITVARDAIVEACRIARDDFGYQQLMEIAGVDYPERAERFEVNYHLLSVTENHRIRLKVSTDEATPVPSVTGLWPVAGWLEREVFDLYGVIFAGNPDLRRILTDYGFEGHPLRKDFPQTGYVELRYSEAEKRVVYEPVQLPQDFRSFDFLMPWEGPEYRLPGDEKAGWAGRRRAEPRAAPSAPDQRRRQGGPRNAQDDRENCRHWRRQASQRRGARSRPASHVRPKAKSAGGKTTAKADPKPAKPARDDQEQG